MIDDERNTNNSASITIYVRLNYFGKSIITEIERFPNDEFHVHEETNESYPYQCREVSRIQLEIGYWNGDDDVHSSLLKQKDLICLDDVNILTGVKARIEDRFEQRGITINPTSDTGKGKEFSSNGVGRIVQETSNRLSTDEKMTMNKGDKGLDNRDVGPYSGDESKAKDTNRAAKKSKKIPKGKKKKKTKNNNITTTTKKRN